ncbi:hypothetical protein PVK06_035965 [Gossypium arboreum]|uniref:Uncharacterized protein n=1 Tax=Gossypium arboreum TaxID=29729 RepID=A0ABR0NI91_GOSAR|nr:hypothetical protein PVK06_035965 [Gossypium arboreum]
MHEEAKEHICPSRSSSCIRKSSLQELILSLQVVLVEAGMVSVRLAEGIDEVKVVGDPFDARKVNFDALNHIIGASLDFDVHFSFGATQEEFVEEWKNSSKLYFAENPIKTSVAPTARHEGGENEGEGE